MERRLPDWAGLALLGVYFLAAFALMVVVERVCDPACHEWGDWRRGAFILGVLPGALPVALFAMLLTPEHAAEVPLSRAAEVGVMVIILGVGTLWAGVLVAFGFSLLIPVNHVSPVVAAGSFNMLIAGGLSLIVILRVSRRLRRQRRSSQREAEAGPTTLDSPPSEPAATGEGIFAKPDGHGHGSLPGAGPQLPAERHPGL